MNPKKEAWEEIAVIEWVNGIGPMPQHLIDQGTVRVEYRRGLRLTSPIVCGVIDESKIQILESEEYQLPEPFYEVRVWGVLTERGFL